MLLIASASVSVSASETTVKFRIAATKAAGNSWVYTLINESIGGEKGESFTLDWNPSNATDDLLQANSSFDPNTGYVLLPDGWMSSPGSFPSVTVSNVFLYDLAPGSSITGFQFNYKNSVYPGWFSVTYRSGIYTDTTSKLAIQQTSVPEPASIFGLLGGLSGVLSFAWRKKGI